MARFDAFLLCAGYGTRLAAVTGDTPKPLVEVAGRPMLDYLIDQILALDGLGGIQLVTNSRHAEAYRRWAPSIYERCAAAEVELTIHDDGTSSNADRLGAIGDLAFVIARGPRLGGALVCAGDNILRFSLAPIWRHLCDQGSSAVLALEELEVERLQRTGVLELRAGRVVQLHEKPRRPPSTWACPPIYVLAGHDLDRVGDYLRAGRPADEIGRLIDYLASESKVMAIETRGQRLSVGTPDELKLANRLLSSM